MQQVIPSFSAPVFTFYGRLAFTMEDSGKAIKLFRAQNPQLLQSNETDKIPPVVAALDKDDWSDDDMGHLWAKYVGLAVPVGGVTIDSPIAPVVVEFGFSQITRASYDFLKLVFPLSAETSHLTFVTSLYVWKIHFKSGQPGISVARGFDFFDTFNPLSTSNLLFWTSESEATSQSTTR